MHENEIRNRIISSLSNKKGPELLTELVSQLVDLHVSLKALQDRIRMLEVFEKFNSSRLIVENAKSSLGETYPLQLTIDASQLQSTVEFYPLEYSADGRPFRWSGPGREFTFNCYISRKDPIEIVLNVVGLIEPRLQSRTTLICDGDTIPLELVEGVDEWSAKAVLPSRDQALKPTTLTFVIPATLRPQNPEDKRLLGVAFHSLSLRPAPAVSDKVIEARAQPRRKAREKARGSLVLQEDGPPLDEA